MEYKIYQMNIGIVKNYEYIFKSYVINKNHGYEPVRDDYELVYSGNIHDLGYYGGIEKVALDVIFETFNICHPSNYWSRSVSVSDIIVIGKNAYYVDSVGFEKLPDTIAYEFINPQNKNGQKTFLVSITETLEKQIKIEADDKNEALIIAKRMINKEEIVLGADDFIGREVEVMKEIG